MFVENNTKVENTKNKKQNNKKTKIPIKCKGSRTVPLSQLQNFQGSLKKLPSSEYRKYKKSILTHGVIDVFKVWRNQDKEFLMDGHQKLLILTDLIKSEKYIVDDLPVSDVFPKDEKEAKQWLLLITSRYGQVTQEGFNNYLKEANITFDNVKLDIELPEIDVDEFEIEMYKGTFEKNKKNIKKLEQASSELKGFEIKNYGFSEFETDGYFEIPKLDKNMICNIPDNIETWGGDDVEKFDDSKYWLWNYNSASLRGVTNFEKLILSFYIDDFSFDKFFFQYQTYLPRMLNLGIKKAVIPNFSLYADEHKTIQAFNAYKSKWLARIMQEVGIEIIVDVNFSDERSYDFCFSGIPEGVEHVIIQNQQIKTKDDYIRHKKGIDEAFERIKFKKLFVYCRLDAVKKNWYNIFKDKFEIQFIGSYAYKRFAHRNKTKEVSDDN